MIFVYLAVAVVLFFSDDFVAELKQPNRSILAGIIVLYAIFKFYRLFFYKRPESSDEEN
ncbi:MAG: hypothetical protein NT150_04225 [Bacteroidetes bacterium]|nr:hypothetical protein [Bacteroidota bacterium]